MESWLRVWRDGFAKIIGVPELEALRDALKADDPRLIQKATTVPPPLSCVQDWPAEGGCLGGYCGVVYNGGFGTATVGETEEYFAKLCFESDQLTGEPADCRHLLNWFDDTPRDEMRNLLLEEVERTLQERTAR